MGKILNTYGGFTSQMIKLRAEIPEQTYMTTGATTVDCVNLNISKIRATLGYSTGATSISTMCISNNVNPYSAFSPKFWAFTGSTSGSTPTLLIHTGYSFGNFAGYNHGATTPHLDFYTPGGTNVGFYYTGGMTYTINVDVFLGEYPWRNLRGDCQAIGIEWSVTGATTNDGIKYVQKLPLTTATYLSNGAVEVAFPLDSGATCTFNNLSGNYGSAFSPSTGKGRLFFCTSGTTGTNGVELCSIPGISPFYVPMTWTTAKYVVDIYYCSTGLIVPGYSSVVAGYDGAMTSSRYYVDSGGAWAGSTYFIYNQGTTGIEATATVTLTAMSGAWTTLVDAQNGVCP